QAAAGQSKPTKTPDHPKPNGLPLCMNFPRTALPLAGRRCRQADEGLPQIRRHSARHQAEQALQELHDHQR
ncbi:hypothetical protein, partial [Sinorhizobium meliloti]|uniref:hypothetical protein n=1 Tax=Rhizobium meliloti TaxID=382 RepID=UPI001AED03D8